MLRDLGTLAVHGGSRLIPRFILPALLAVGIIVASGSVAFAQTDGAINFVKDLGARAIDTLKDGSLDQEARKARFDQLLQNGFDMRLIGRFVLGRNWRALTPEQQENYLALFESYVLEIYASRLVDYSGEKLKVLSEQAIDDKDVLVNSKIGREDAPGFDVVWRVRSGGDRYRVIDVMVEGVSLLVTQRAEFAAVIQRKGLDGLFKMLRDRVNARHGKTAAAS
ncbi:MAG: phospholipid-binding protein MlaC [Alphaproteobacteria bacterium]